MAILLFRSVPKQVILRHTHMHVPMFPDQHQLVPAKGSDPVKCEASCEGPQT